MNRSALVIALALGSVAGPLRATEEDSGMTPPAGCVRIDLPASKTNAISVPLLRDTVAVGRVAEYSGNSISVTGAQWASNQFAPASGLMFYLQIVTGELAGVTYQVTGNSQDRAFVDLGSENLSQHPLKTSAGLVADQYNGTKRVVAGDIVCIRPYWTVGQVFGNSDSDVALGSVSAISSQELLNGADRLSIPDNAAPGHAKLPKEVLVYVSGQGWRKISDMQNDQGDYPIPAGNVMLAERGAGADAAVVVVGHVQTFRAATRIAATGNAGADQWLSWTLAEPVELENSGLSGTSLAAHPLRSSPSVFDRQDEVHLFGGVSPEPFASGKRFLYVLPEGWRSVSEPSQNVGPGALLFPASGILLRLRPEHPGGYWLQHPNYQ